MFHWLTKFGLWSNPRFSSEYVGKFAYSKWEKDGATTHCVKKIPTVGVKSWWFETESASFSAPFLNWLLVLSRELAMATMGFSPVAWADFIWKGDAPFHLHSDNDRQSHDIFDDSPWPMYWKSCYRREFPEAIPRYVQVVYNKNKTPPFYLVNIQDAIGSILIMVPSFSRGSMSTNISRES